MFTGADGCFSPTLHKNNSNSFQVKDVLSHCGRIWDGRITRFSHMCKDYFLFKGGLGAEGMLGSACVVTASLCQKKDGNDFMFCGNIYHHSKQGFAPPCLFRGRGARSGLFSACDVSMRSSKALFRSVGYVNTLRRHTPWTTAKLNALVMLWAQQRSCVNNKCMCKQKHSFI